MYDYGTIESPDQRQDRVDRERYRRQHPPSTYSGGGESNRCDTAQRPWVPKPPKPRPAPVRYRYEEEDRLVFPTPPPDQIIT